MATWTDMPLGVSGGLEKVDYDYSVKEIVEPYGLGERRYWGESTLTISTEEQICALGLEPDAGGLGGSGDITDVTATYTEQATDPDMEPVSPGSDVATGVRLMKMDDDCFIFTGTEKKYSISGKGILPVDPATAQNDYLTNYVTKDFAAAYGAFTIAVDSEAQIGNIKKSQPKDNFHTWSIEAACVIENPSPSASHLLALPSEVSALVPADMLGPYSVTHKMTQGKNRATTSYSLTLNYTT